MLTEIVKDTNGIIIKQNRPYPFRRLFKAGQMYIEDSIEQKVVSCTEHNNLVTTIVQARATLDGE